ncbi:hypothetical protein E2C01_024719 [Portunus trituberculatus]|uniref:Uncharacterized protein n=1 Tax=Portunus trituberculatus TaxID=210409 RepID=A0A5B7EB22_PORTR|nr:hypothetical protein [Portunus trituberculatus]
MLGDDSKSHQAAVYRTPPTLQHHPPALPIPFITTSNFHFPSQHFNLSFHTAHNFINPSATPSQHHNPSVLPYLALTAPQPFTAAAKYPAAVSQSVRPQQRPHRIPNQSDNYITLSERQWQ